MMTVLALAAGIAIGVVAATAWYVHLMRADDRRHGRQPVIGRMAAVRYLLGRQS